MMSDSHRGLRRLSILGTAILVLVAGVLLYLRRPHASVRAPEPKHSEYAGLELEEKPVKASRRPEAEAPAVDPLESTRQAPVVAKGPVKSNAMAAVTSPIAASAGAGPDRFVIRDRNVNASFTNRGVPLAMLSAQDPSMSGYAMRWGLDGAVPVEPQPKGELPAKINRLIGDSSQWQTNQSTYSKIVYPDVKPGVD